MCYMLYSCNKAGNKKCYEENYKKEKIQDYTVLIKKNPRVSEPTKFKPMVFKGQLYVFLLPGRNQGQREQI